MSGHLDHNLLDLPALVLDAGEQRGLRDLLLMLNSTTTVSLERRGLTQPLIATVEDPNVGEARFLIALGSFAELPHYPAPDEPLSPNEG